MVQTSWTDTQSAVNNTSHGTVAWINPQASEALDGSANLTDANLSNNEDTNYLHCTNFGFSLPAAANVLGIEARFLGSSLGVSALPFSRVRLVKGGSIQTNERATGNLSASTFYTFGSSADVWDDTWTAGDINDSGFGVVFAFTMPTAFAETASNDVIQMRITYNFAESASIDTVLQQAMARTASIDLIASQRSTPTASIDAALQAAFSKAASIDAALQGGRTVTTGIDAALQGMFSKTASIDAALQQPFTVAASADAALQGAFSKTTSIGMSLQKKFSLSTSMDCVLRNFWRPDTDVTTLWKAV